MSHRGDDRTSSMLGGFVLGALAGAAVALLIAPRTGEDTRHRVGDMARRVGEEGRKRWASATGSGEPDHEGTPSQGSTDPEASR